ncbi:DUF5946 family protein [Pseudactinotalea sp. Z1739]|uniref:DUF5946 family protein n=1 Tax=Pseudactinotalea sp. Z1739 TaxID=3413028 RepID=UPI003C7AA0BF
MTTRDEQPGATCAECGSGGSPGCEALFDRLLALDHSRAEPWGPLHAVAVACYRLQHPSALPAGDERWLLQLLRAYLDGGPEGLNRWVDGARRANARRHHARPAARVAPTSGSWPRAGNPTAFETTLTDVAVNGTFPASGYRDRVRAWAQATLTAWDG